MLINFVVDGHAINTIIATKLILIINTVEHSVIIVLLYQE